MTAEVSQLVGLAESVGASLGADRCWLYARIPERRRGIALVRWLRHAGVPDVPDDLCHWTDEAPDLPERDPLLARALAGEPLDAVADVADAEVDAELERALGHRSFVHVNLHLDGVLWGTLQPGMTIGPRTWSGRERSQLLAIRPAAAAVLAAVVTEHGEDLSSQLVVAG
jgi:GAF domain-containing protein